VFNMNVAKVVWDVEYVAMVIHVGCKRVFQMFHLFFSDVCCMCFYLDVAHVLHIYYICFTNML